MKNRILIFANGSLNESFIKEVRKSDYIIGVDAASYWLIRHNIHVHCAIGDFDSVTKEKYDIIKKKAAKVISFSSKKDFTDLHLALNCAIGKNPGEIILYGTVGSRLDQSLSSIFLLQNCLNKNIQACIRDDHNELFLVNNSVEIQKSDIFPYLSFLSLTQTSTISIFGCRYNVEKKTMKQTESLGVSNEIHNAKAKLIVYNGTVLVIRSRN